MPSEGGARQRSTRACHPSPRHRPPVPHAIETLLPYPSNSPLGTLSSPPPPPLPYPSGTTRHTPLCSPSLLLSLPLTSFLFPSSSPFPFFMQGERRKGGTSHQRERRRGGGEAEGRGRREGEKEGRKTVSSLLAKSAGADVYDCQRSKILTAWIPVFPSPHVMINLRRQPSLSSVPLGVRERDSIRKREEEKA